MICIRRFRHSLICPMLTRMSDEFSEMDSHICLRCTSIFFKVQTLHMFVIFSNPSYVCYIFFQILVGVEKIASIILAGRDHRLQAYSHRHSLRLQPTEYVKRMSERPS